MCKLGWLMNGVPWTSSRCSKETAQKQVSAQLWTVKIEVYASTLRMYNKHTATEADHKSYCVTGLLFRVHFAGDRSWAASDDWCYWPKQDPQPANNTCSKISRSLLTITKPSKRGKSCVLMLGLCCHRHRGLRLRAKSCSEARSYIYLFRLPV